MIPILQMKKLKLLQVSMHAHFTLKFTLFIWKSKWMTESKFSLQICNFYLLQQGSRAIPQGTEQDVTQHDLHSFNRIQKEGFPFWSSPLCVSMSLCIISLSSLSQSVLSKGSMTQEKTQRRVCLFWVCQMESGFSPLVSTGSGQALSQWLHLWTVQTHGLKAMQRRPLSLLSFRVIGLPQLRVQMKS